MKRTLLICLLFGLLSALCAPLFAQTANGLYTVDLPVAARDDVTRTQALRTGLLKVLQRVTGQPQSATAPLVVQALEHPESYLQSYTYSGENGAAGVLHMNFTESAVKKLVHGAGLPAWSQNRPTVAVAVTLQDGSAVDDIALSAYADGKYEPVMRSAMAEWGMPAQFAGMDLQDRMQFQALQADPTTNNATLTALLARYGATALLAGQVIRSADGQWRGQWNFRFGEQRGNFVTGPEGDPGEQFAVASTRLANEMASRFSFAAASTGAVSEWDIDVSGVTSYGAYRDLLGYLSKLAPVRVITLQGVRAGNLRLHISLQGEVARFDELLLLEGKLRRLPEVVALPSTPNSTATTPAATTPVALPEVLHYQWVAPVVATP